MIVEKQKARATLLARRRRAIIILSLVAILLIAAAITVNYFVRSTPFTDVDGTKYYVEEYDDREFVTSKFYYIGDDLKMLIVTDSSTGSVQYTYFDDISFKVDDSMFEVPALAFDLSPILKTFFVSLLLA